MSNVAARSINNSDSEEMLCFSFALRDLNFFLFFYNASFYLYLEFIKNSYSASFLSAFLLSLGLLYIVVLVNLFEMVTDEEEVKLKKEEAISITKKIKREYQKVFKNNHKKELLVRVNNCGKGNSPIISKTNKLLSKLKPRVDSKEIVHFDYLDRHGTTGLHS